MPSLLLGYPLASGAQPVISGWIWSGTAHFPVGGIQFRLSQTASGRCYIGLSGGTTMNSGGCFSGALSGLLDGMELGPGDSYFLPRLGTGASGVFGVWARHDAAISGQGRLYFEIF